jgi:hypothetical protein
VPLLARCIPCAACILVVQGVSAGERQALLPTDTALVAHVERPATSTLAAAHYLLTTAGVLDAVAVSLNRNYRIPKRSESMGRECGGT